MKNGLMRPKNSAFQMSLLEFVLFWEYILQQELFTQITKLKSLESLLQSLKMLKKLTLVPFQEHGWLQP